MKTFQKKDEFEMLFDDEKIDFVQALQMPGSSGMQVLRFPVIFCTSFF